MMENNNINNIKLINIWLLTTIILVFLMIIVGGLTRLTDSGLSITQWELFTGILPPLTNESWNNYFDLYKKIPQFKLINPTMSLEEFKIIFYWEYFHRLFGRIIGLVYILPLIYFTITKSIEKRLLYTFYFIFLMILFQGFLGWYMVESGLINDVTVSHYRLSLHLFFAFLIMSFLFWNYLNYTSNNKKFFFNTKNKLIKSLFILILIQIIFGAFVSGLDAGLIYQTWPKMNLSYVPDDIDLSKFNLSFFNEQSFVQFLHRLMAYFIIAVVIIVGIKMFIISKSLNLKSYLLVVLIIILQVALGILTLISGLNLYLASLHQITSIILVLSVLNLNHKMS